MQRRPGTVAPVNPVPEVGRRNPETPLRQVRQSRGRRATDQVFYDHIPAPVLVLDTNSEVIVGLAHLGEAERNRTSPNAYEAASRYEDRYFETIETGLLGRKFA